MGLRKIVKGVRRGLGLPAINVRNVARLAAGSSLPAAGAIGMAMRLVPSSGFTNNPGLPPLPQIPTPGVRGAIQRRLPGGKTGYEPAAPLQIPTPGARGAIERFLPGGKSGYLSTGFAPVVQGEQTTRIKCPKGYVAVDLDGDGEAEVCMMKPLAQKMGYWKARPKPPISGWDAKAIRRAASAKKRVKKLAQNVGFVATEKGRARRGGGGSSSGGRKKC